MTFDYEAETPIDAVLSVADAIRSSDRLAPFTDEQKAVRRIEIEAWHEEQAWLSEQRRIEREQQQDEAESAARQEAALALAEENKRMRLERQEQIARQVRDREIADLRFKSVRHEAFQRNLENAARNTMAYQARQTLMNEIEALVCPPAPPPEPQNMTEIVYVSEDEAGSPHLGDRDFNPKLWTKI